MLGHLDQRRFAQLRGRDQQVLRLGEYFFAKFMNQMIIQQDILTLMSYKITSVVRCCK